MNRNVHQPGQPPGVHTRNAGHRLGIEHTITNDPEAAFSLRHQKTPVREKHQTPRMRQATRHHNQTNLVVLGRLEYTRAVWQGQRRKPGRRLSGGADGAAQQKRDSRHGDRTRASTKREKYTHGVGLPGRV